MNFKTFEVLDNHLKDLIAKDRIDQALSIMRDYFEDDEGVDQLTILSRDFYSLNRELQDGILKSEDAKPATNKFVKQLMSFLRTRKTLYASGQLIFGGEVEEVSLIPVFYSHCTPHNEEQRQLGEALIAYCKELGIWLRALQVWNGDDPILPIIDDIKSSYGCLVLALERFYVEKGIEKRNSDKETTANDSLMTSAWLHIEIGLVRAFEKPLIILKDQDLKNEGLIHNKKQAWSVVTFPGEKISGLLSDTNKRFLQIWARDVKEYYENNKR